MSVGSNEVSVWYAVQGGVPHCILVNPGLSVALLKDAIKAKHPSMSQVDPDKITIYQSEQHFKDDPAKALTVDAEIKSVLENGGTNANTALYVHFEQPSQAAASSTDQEMTKKLEEISRVLTDLAATVQGDLAARVQGALALQMQIPPASSTLDVGWKKRVLDHYAVDTCIVLSQWARAYPEWTLPPGLSGSVVGEHIFPKAPTCNALAIELQIEVYSEANGLPMLKHLEEKVGTGAIMLNPLGDEADEIMKLQVLVCNDILDEQVLMGFPDSARRQPLRLRMRSRGKTWWYDVKFRDLHRFEFSVSPRPSRRALFLKCQLAWRNHQEEFPNPLERVDEILTGCNKKELFMRLVATSTPTVGTFEGGT